MAFIQRIHHTPSGLPQGNGKSRPIHVAFLTYEDHEALYTQALEPFETQTLLGKKSLCPKLEILSAEGKICIFVYPANFKYRENNVVKTYNG